jgi:hypothetical protein
MPLASRSASALVTLEIGSTAVEAPGRALARSRALACPVGITVSTSVFHASHDGHCPDHFGELAPHCWQT